LLNPESRVPQLLAKDRRQVLQEADRINFALVIDISQKQIGLDLTKVILNRNQQNAVNIILGAEIPCSAKSASRAEVSPVI
jgi:hypothetical protein